MKEKNVPQALRKLIPMVQRFGIGDDYSRERLVSNTSTEDLVLLVSSFERESESLESWLYDSVAESVESTPEYVGFTNCTMAIDSARLVLKNRGVLSFRIPGKEFNIFCIESGWGMVHEGKLVSFADYHNCLFLFPLMELKLERARALVSAQAKPLNSSASQFPFENIIRLAIEEHSDYWVALSLNWLESGIEVGDKLFEILKKNSERKSLSQSTRHRMVSLAMRSSR